MNLKPISIDEFCNFRSISNLTFSPSGKSACFTVSQAREGKNDYHSCIYVRKDGQIRQLTSGGKERGFCYLDEDTVLFPADREGEKEPSLESRYYKICLSGGAATLAYTFPIPVEQVIPLTGGDLLGVG